MAERYIRNGKNSLREWINRRFPLKIIRGYSHEQQEEEIQQVQMLPYHRRITYARNFAEDGNPYIVARFLHLSGMQRKISREIMTQCLTVYADELNAAMVEKIREAVLTPLSFQRGYTDSLSGEEILTTLRRSNQILGQIERLGSPTRLQKLLDKIL